MPLPSPSKNEKQSDFISRCMGNTESNKNFPDQKQRAAVCYSQWKKKKKKSKATQEDIVQFAELSNLSLEESEKTLNTVLASYGYEELDIELT